MYSNSISTIIYAFLFLSRLLWPSECCIATLSLLRAIGYMLHGSVRAGVSSVHASILRWAVHPSRPQSFRTGMRAYSALFTARLCTVALEPPALALLLCGDGPGNVYTLLRPHTRTLAGPLDRDARAACAARVAIGLAVAAAHLSTHQRDKGECPDAGRRNWIL